MIGGNSEKGFLAAHWDWLLLGAGALALVGGIVVMTVVCGEDPEEAAAEASAEIRRQEGRRQAGGYVRISGGPQGF